MTITNASSFFVMVATYIGRGYRFEMFQIGDDMYCCTVINNGSRWSGQSRDSLMEAVGMAINQIRNLQETR